MLGFFGLSPMSVIMIAIVAIMLFGSDLPEVARKFGARYREFRRAINDVQQQFRDISNDTRDAFSADDKPAGRSYEEEDDEDDEPAAPKFKPPA